MKTTIKLITLLLVVNVYSQKIKIKKEIVLIDKKEVCKLVEKERGHYNLQSLDGKEVLDFEFESKTIETLEGDKQFDFLKFKNKTDNQIYYCDYDISGLKSSFSGEKTLVRHLIKKNQFLSKDKINYTKIKEFFSQPRPRNSDMEEEISKYKAAYKAVTDFKLKFDGRKILKKGDEKDIFVGSYKVETSKKTGFTTIKVFDAKGFLTGTYVVGTSSITLFDRNNIKYRVTSRDNVENAQKIIKRMIIAGYTLGDMKNKKANIRIANHKNEVRSEMKNSVNIYKKKAIVYADGEKITGKVTLEFKELNSQKSGISNLKNYGGVATLETIKENGKKKFKDYKAKDGVKICFNVSKKCYQGITTKGMMAPKFNLEIDVTGKLKLYKSKSFNYYVFKKDNAEKGLIITASVMFKEDNSKKMFEKIFEYLDDCPNLKDNLNTSEINLKSEDDLIKIVKAYNSCK